MRLPQCVHSYVEDVTSTANSKTVSGAVDSGMLLVMLRRNLSTLSRSLFSSTPATDQSIA